MRYRLIAAFVSFVTIVVAARGLRPRYGGTLRVETTAGGEIWETQFAGQIYETLVRSTAHGEMQAWLATGWTHDAAAGKWQFAARKNVMLHSGLQWTPGENVLSATDGEPLEETLAEAGQADKAIAESGPFRILNQSADAVTLGAHESYWGGRPFLDTIEIQLGRTRRDQVLDFEVGKTDVAEAEVTDVKALKQRGAVVQVSKPLETVALIFENAKVSSELRQAVALSIDRVAIQRVLLDRQGDASGGLLPQWISGYAFLFPAGRDAERARKLAGSGASLMLCEDTRDLVLRSVADRISVDTGQAGLTLRQASRGCDVRLVRLGIRSMNAQEALLGIARALHVAAPVWGPAYEMERELLRDSRVVPLFQLPLVFALGPNVRNWSAEWNLADVWLEGAE